jgi:hypothetical protein
MRMKYLANLEFQELNATTIKNKGNENNDTK